MEALTAIKQMPLVGKIALAIVFATCIGGLYYYHQYLSHLG